MKKPKKKYHSISYPRFVLKFKKDGEWKNILHTKKITRIIFRIGAFGGKFKWDKAFLRFQYNKKFHNEGYYYNVKDLENAFRAFKEILPEFDITYK